ncbi:MAG: TerB family tellurite resistance protein [Pseudomonadota bacterium]
MLDALKKLLTTSGDPPVLPEDAAREAVAALLVSAARADGVYDPGEVAAIDAVLTRHYALDPAQAETLRRAGEEAEAAATDLVRFTRAVKQTVPHPDRVAIIEAVWEVAYADGDRDHQESALVRKLCGLLYVEDREAGLARQRVQARRVVTPAPD